MAVGLPKDHFLIVTEIDGPAALVDLRVESVAEVLRSAGSADVLFSGEHGIGNDKSAYMPMVFGTESMRLQLAIPQVFNPRHQFNPMKVFTERRFAA